MSATSPLPTIEQFAAKLEVSLADGTFVRLVLSRPVTAGEGLEKLLGRLVDLKGAPHLSLTLRYATRDVTKNLPVTEAAGWAREQLGGQFRSALLGTTRRDWQWTMSDSGETRLVGHKPAVKETPSRDHDQRRHSILDDSARDWLEGLGVVFANGKVRVSMADKYAQINRYLEIFTHLARDCGWTGERLKVQGPTSNVELSTAHNSEPGTLNPELTLADMGSGKGYLTFGLWHLFRRVGRQAVRVIGVETRPDLVAADNRLARQIGAEGLEFIEGTIQTAPLPSLDALVALHACNTATDDAIRRGIDLGARLIVVAPCCHQEVRPQLALPHPLTPVLRHGLMGERMAEWVTDGLRALFLEWAGYRTKMIEFVSTEHTPKNLMIAAIRQSEPFASPAVREQIEQFRTFWGIQHHALDPLLERGNHQTEIP